MNCKDCIHYEACTMFEDYEDEYAAKNACDIFKDKSKFIELPCKVSDTVYVITRGCYKKDIVECRVKTMRIKNDNTTIMFSCRGKYHGYYYNGNFVFNSMGKTVFLTKEEAEKKLKELSE